MRCLFGPMLLTALMRSSSPSSTLELGSQSWHGTRKRRSLQAPRNERGRHGDTYARRLISGELLCRVSDAQRRCMLLTLRVRLASAAVGLAEPGDDGARVAQVRLVRGVAAPPLVGALLHHRQLRTRPQPRQQRAGRAKGKTMSWGGTRGEKHFIIITRAVGIQRPTSCSGRCGELLQRCRCLPR